MPLADGDAPEMDASLHRTRRGGGLRVLTVAELTKRVALTPAVAQLVGPNGAIVILADADTRESGRARHDDRHAGNELVVRVREPKRPAVQLMAARHATSCKHAAAGGYELDSSRHGPGPAARHIVASRTDQWEVRRAPAVHDAPAIQAAREYAAAQRVEQERHGKAGATAHSTAHARTDREWTDTQYPHNAG